MIYRWVQILIEFHYRLLVLPFTTTVEPTRGANRVSRYFMVVVVFFAKAKTFTIVGIPIVPRHRPSGHRKRILIRFFLLSLYFRVRRKQKKKEFRNRFRNAVGIVIKYNNDRRLAFNPKILTRPFLLRTSRWPPRAGLKIKDVFDFVTR